MTLARRARDDFDLSDWFSRRFTWPEVFTAFTDDMRVEEFEEDGTLVVRAELPGVDPDKDVEITVSDHLLRIKAEKREETKTEDKKHHRSEFRYGSFERVVTLPAGATDEDVKATYTDGVLEVRIPMDRSVTAARTVPVTRT